MTEQASRTDSTAGVDLSGFYTDTHGGGDELPRTTPAEVGATATATWRHPTARYAFRRVVAIGGMGAVLRMWDPRVERDVAMKVLLPPVVPRRVERFWREARLTAALSHPNIVAVHELGLTPLDEPYFTMKLVEGEGLNRLIEEWSELPPAKQPSLAARMRIGRRVCDAIAYAHERGVHHLDVKPQNVLVGAFGEVIVIDWGVAQIADDPDVASDRPTGSIIGTPGFMAPEQAAGLTDQVSARTDVYALGALFYALATLKPPLVGDSIEQLLAHNRDGRVVPPHQRGKCPLALSRIIMRAMAKAPGDRYPSVSLMLADVEAWLDGRAPVAAGLGLLERFALFLRRHRGLARGLVVGALVLTAVAGIAVVRVQTENNRAKVGEAAALSAETLARQQSANAEAARQAADTAQALAERAAYAAEIRFAHHALRQGRRRAAAAALDQCAESRRDWAWRWLRQGVDQFVTGEGIGATPTAAIVAGDRVFAIVGSDVAVWRPDGTTRQLGNRQYRQMSRSQDDQPLLVFNDSGAIGLHAPASGKQIWATSTGPHGIIAAANVGDGQHLLLAVGEQLQVFDLTANRVVRSSSPGLGSLRGLLPIGDGHQFIVRGESRELVLWDLAGGVVKRRYQLSGTPLVQALDRPRRRLVVVDAEGTVSILDLASGRETGLAISAISAAVVDDRHEAIAFGRRDGGVEVWSLTSLRQIASLQVSRGQGILALGWQDGDVVVVGRGGEVGRWRLPSWPKSLAGVVPTELGLRAVLADSGKAAVFGGRALLLYDPATPTQHRRLALPASIIAARADDQRAVVVTASGSVLAVEFLTAASRPLLEFSLGVDQALFSLNGENLLWRNSQGAWSLTDLAAGKTVLQPGLTGWQPLRFISAGLLVARRDGQLACLRVAAGVTEVWRIELSGVVLDAAVVDDDLSLLIRDPADGAVRLLRLRLASGTMISATPLSAGAKEGASIGFSPEGMVFVDDEGLLIVADSAGNQLLALDLGDAAQPRLVAASQTTIVAASAAGDLQIWHVPEDSHENP